MNKFENTAKQKKDTKKRSEVSPGRKMGTRINRLIGDLFNSNHSARFLETPCLVHRLEVEHVSTTKIRLRKK
jgi:hypothetical protein